MDNIVSINNTKENTLDFEMTIEGVETGDIKCKFCISMNKMELSFEAKLADKKDGKWTVKLPKLDILDRTAYPCHISVVADGYYFEPMKGTLNVIGSAEIYSSTPKNTSFNTEKKKDVKPVPKKTNETWRQAEKSIEQIANELLSARKYDSDKVDDKVEELREASKHVDTNKDSTIRRILEEAGIKPKKKPERISFVKTRTLN